MKSRARIVLAISFAVLSTGTIVTCATVHDTKRPPPQLNKLKQFATHFNETINDAIRSPDATTFASQKCDATFVDQHIQNVANAAAPVCTFSRSTKQELRSKVNDWIDAFYPDTGGGQPPSFADPLPGCTIDASWFLMKVDTSVTPGPLTDFDGSVIPPDAGDGG